MAVLPFPQHREPDRWHNGAPVYALDLLTPDQSEALDTLGLSETDIIERRPALYAVDPTKGERPAWAPAIAEPHILQLSDAIVLYRGRRRLLGPTGRIWIDEPWDGRMSRLL